MKPLEESLTEKRRIGNVERLEFYFPDSRILTEFEYRPAGRYWEFDEYIGKERPVNLDLLIAGHTNCSDKSIASDIFRAIITWRLMKYPDSRALPRHWSEFLREDVVISEALYGILGPEKGYQLRVGQDEVKRAMELFSADIEHRRVKLGPKIKYL
jgi:hypothetical protein